MYLNTRDPHSIVARLSTINTQIDGAWDGFFNPADTLGFDKWRALVAEARALETILSRWVLIFAVGDDPPMLY